MHFDTYTHAHIHTRNKCAQTGSGSVLRCRIAKLRSTLLPLDSLDWSKLIAEARQVGHARTSQRTLANWRLATIFHCTLARWLAASGRTVSADCGRPAAVGPVLKACPISVPASPPSPFTLAPSACHRPRALCLFRDRTATRRLHISISSRCGCACVPSQSVVRSRSLSVFPSFCRASFSYYFSRSRDCTYLSFNFSLLSATRSLSRSICGWKFPLGFTTLFLSVVYFFCLLAGVVECLTFKLLKCWAGSRADIFW